MTTFPIDPPGAFSSLSLNLNVAAASERSVVNGLVQTSHIAGGQIDAWTGTATTAMLSKQTALPWHGFVARMRGVVGTVRLPVQQDIPLAINQNRTIRMRGGSQLVRQIILDGFVANQGLVLRAGDLIQIGDEVKRVTVDTGSDSTGAASVEFEPILRAQALDNDIVDVLTPKLIARFLEPQEVDANVRDTPFSFAFIEEIQKVT